MHSSPQVTSYSSPKLTISKDCNTQTPFRSCPIIVGGWRLQDHYQKGDNSSLKNKNFNLGSFCQTDSLCSCRCTTKLRRLTVFLIIFIESRKTTRNRIYRYLEPVTITGISEIVTSNLCFTWNNNKMRWQRFTPISKSAINKQRSSAQVID